MQEIWKDIKGYEGLYQVSNLGRIKSNTRYGTKGGVLKLRLDKDGYFQTALYKNNKVKYYRTHRLVAEAFIPNPNNYPIINHKDENRSNNLTNNLEWCTYKYNSNYGNVNVKIANSKYKPVYQYSLDDRFIHYYSSLKEMEKITGFGYSNISSCCNGRLFKSHGYKWSYTPLI
jgi:hypothetical protein